MVSGALDWLSRTDAGELTTAAISPDLGERYLETVYTDEWVEEHHGDVLAHDEPEPQNRAATDACRATQTVLGDPIAIGEGPA